MGGMMKITKEYTTLKHLLRALILAIAWTSLAFGAAQTSYTTATPDADTKLLGTNAAGATKNYTLPAIKTYVGAGFPSATEGQILQANSSGTYVSVSSFAGLINDAGTAGDDLWSAAKVISYVVANAGSGSVSDTAYDATSWDGVTTVAPSKNAIRDKLAAMDSTIAAISVAAPTVQSADPTSASAQGWYCATGSGDCFYKSSAGLFTLPGSYAADTFALTVDGTGWDGTDSITVGGTTYTADGTKTGLSGSTSVAVAPNTGRSATCSGTGVTGSSSPYTADMMQDRTIACTFSASGLGTPDFSWNGDNGGGDLVAAKKSGTVSGTLSGATVVVGSTDPGTASSDGGDVLKVPANGYLRFIESSIVDMQTGYLSLYVYVPASVTGWNEFFELNNALNTQYMYFSVSPSKTVRFTTTTPTVVQNDSTIAFGTGWHLFEARWSATNVSIRINGGSWENLNSGFTTSDSVGGRVYLGFSSQISTNTIYIDGAKVWKTYDQQ